MAGDWIKMKTNLDTNPKVIQLATELEISELHVVGLLWKVWSWADQHSIDGNAISVTDATLDRFTGVTGFANALRNVGWLEGENGSLSFPRFEEHNGQTAKKRANTNKRVANHRNAKSVTDVTPKVLPEKRREEKRREENTTTDDCTVGGQSSYVSELLSLDVDYVERDTARFREISNASKRSVPPFLVAEICFLSRWKDREMFRSVAKLVASPDCRNPRKYVEGAIKRKCEEVGVDLLSFRQSVAKAVESVKATGNRQEAN